MMLQFSRRNNKMDDKELISNLEYLVVKYIEDNREKKELLDLIKIRGGSVAKGILDDINKSKVPFDEKDSKIIKDIVFYYV